MAFTLRQPPRQSLVDSIEAQLRDALISGRLRPGERLKTRELAEQLGTSPTPVREALIRLTAAGALAAEPGQAFRVPMLSRREYLEICRIRRAVEGLAAEQAAARITVEDIAELQRIEAHFLQAKREGQVEDALLRNKSFRFTLYEAADMPHLLAIIESLWLRIGPCFNYLYPQQALGEHGHHNYDDVIAALRQRDAVTVRAAIERAIEQGTEILLPQLPADDRDRAEGTRPAALALP